MTIYCDKSKLPRRRVLDAYPTPADVIINALDRLDLNPVYVLDPGAGSGNWGKEVRFRWPSSILYGVEIQDLPCPSGYSHWVQRDFKDFPANGRFDLVVGNPPYPQAEAFVRRSLSLCRPNGIVCFLLRLAFLEGQARGEGLWTEFPPYEVAVCSKRPSFTGDSKTDATAYAVFYWMEGWKGNPLLTWL